MKLNLSQEQFPSMAGFPIICMKAALGPWSPQVSLLRGRLCTPRGFPEHKFIADSIIKGRGKGRLILPKHSLEMWTKAGEGIQLYPPDVLWKWNFPLRCHTQ